MLVEKVMKKQLKSEKRWGEQKAIWEGFGKWVDGNGWKGEEEGSQGVKGEEVDPLECGGLFGGVAPAEEVVREGRQDVNIEVVGGETIENVSNYIGDAEEPRSVMGMRGGMSGVGFHCDGIGPLEADDRCETEDEKDEVGLWDINETIERMLREESPMLEKEKELLSRAEQDMAGVCVDDVGEKRRGGGKGEDYGRARQRGLEAEILELVKKLEDLVIVGPGVQEFGAYRGPEVDCVDVVMEG
jgi:hypothetical protein